MSRSRSPRASAKISRSRSGANSEPKSWRVELAPAAPTSTALTPLEPCLNGWSSIARRRDPSVDPTKLRIIEIVGDSMAPTLNPGDHVLIDGTNHLSSSGLWVIWDGLGETVKQIEPVPNFYPTRVRIRPHNERYSTCERSVSEVVVVGRVVCSMINVA